MFVLILLIEIGPGRRILILLILLILIETACEFFSSCS
jgi:hypothetical protein